MERDMLGRLDNKNNLTVSYENSFDYTSQRYNI